MNALGASSPERPPPRRNASALVRYGAVLVACAGAGWVAGTAGRHWSAISLRWLDAAERRYVASASDSGPVTYLVTHGGFDTLRRSALELDGVLGIEMYRYPDIAAIAIVGADDGVADRLAALPVVSRVRRVFVPMFCH